MGCKESDHLVSVAGGAAWGDEDSVRRVVHAALARLGRCLKKYGDNPHYVPGCPPQMFLITDEFRELVGGQRLFGPKDQYRLACEEEEGD
ncbi:MAG: hypothetical protein ACOY40_09715 [Bacillota bacterium]